MTGVQTCALPICNGGFSGGYQGGGNGGYQGGASAAGNAGQSAAPATDPWGTSGDAGSSFGSFGGSSDFGGDSQEPEF